MSLLWQIDPETRRVTITADGDFTRGDIEDYVRAVYAGGAVNWAKLFDGRVGRPAMGHEDILALGVLFRSYAQRGPVGPLAVVVGDTQVERIERLLGILAAADRPMRVFRSLAPAQRWIERQPSA